jgi:hypothetical protein
MLPGVRPLWLICEDGTEYLERFARFLGDRFQFAHAQDGPALLLALQAGPAAGVILDLDFGRTPREHLIDEEGLAGAAHGEAERRRLSASQGILILRLLRAAGHQVPVLLFADLEDPGQADYLTQTLAPLVIVPGHEGLLATAARMEALSAG